MEETDATDELVASDVVVKVEESDVDINVDVEVAIVVLAAATLVKVTSVTLAGEC